MHIGGHVPSADLRVASIPREHTESCKISKPVEAQPEAHSVDSSQSLSFEEAAQTHRITKATVASSKGPPQTSETRILLIRATQIRNHQSYSCFPGEPSQTDAEEQSITEKKSTALIRSHT